MRCGEAIVLGNDHVHASRLVRRNVVIPYTAHHILNSAAQAWAARLPLASPMLAEPDASLDDAAFIQLVRERRRQRDVSFTFHGMMTRKNEGAHRSVLFDLTEGIDNTSIHDVHAK